MTDRSSVARAQRSPDGLTSADAAARLQADGHNVLPTPRRPGWLRRLAGELVHFFAVMLWVAAALAWVAGLPALAVAIAVVVVLNGVFAFAQETRSERAAERLRILLPARVSARRDGIPVVIDVADVVRGDVLLLDAGDRIPADASVVVGGPLQVDMSLLTGESTPVRVGTGDDLQAGTFVVEGTGEAIVTATGNATRLAGITRLMSTEGRATPLMLGLRQLVRTIAAIAVVVGAVFFVVALLFRNTAGEGFLFAIGVTVAMVPEALLPTVTLSLAYGAEQMSRRQVLVRNLEAVETLGSTTFVCTDKTGTLTLNRMTVVEAWTAEGSVTVHSPGSSDLAYGPTASLSFSDESAHSVITSMATAAVRCSTGQVQWDGEHWVARGDPMEAALDAFARRLGADVGLDREQRREVARFPFDPRRRRMSVMFDDGAVVVKGAPDAVMPMCTAVAPETHTVLARYTARGLRVLAVASRPGPPEAAEPGPVLVTPFEQGEQVEVEQVEVGLTLRGLVALEDPPRPDVSASMRACRRAGVRIAMITGDHPATAVAIAEEVGLRLPDAPIVLGSDLPDDLDDLGAVVDHDGAVIARVSPEDKLRIAQALRRRGHVIAMTGDGVNDAPALHAADIGVAMGASGTDVAREAADLVLLDDHFASIVVGIEQGRATFVNIRRFLTYHLTDNVAELTPFVVWALSGGQFPLALGVLQILALDIGTDTLSAVALGAEPPGRHLLDGPAVTGRLLDRTVLRRSFCILGPVIAAMSMLAFVVSLVAQGWRPGHPTPDGMVASASGATFMTIVLAQSVNAFACRSTSRRPDQLGWTSNRLLLVSVPTELAVALTVVFVPQIAHQLGHASPPLWGWLVAVSSMAVVLAVDGLDKHRRLTAHLGRGGVVDGP